MKSTHSKVLVIGAAIILAVAAAFAQGMHGPGGRGGFGPLLGFYSDYLDLTSAQQDQIKAIWAKEKTAVQPLMQQMKQYHSQMQQLTANGAFDEAKVRALATQQAQVQVEMAVQHARIKSEMVQVLTADQKTKLANFEAKRAARRGQGPPPAEPLSEPPAD